VAFAPLVAGAYDVEQLQNSGDPVNRIDMVILGDGYRDVEQTTLHNDAVTLVNGLFAVTPYEEYRSLFNIYLVHVISNESGADYATGRTAADLRDTALGAYFWCYDIERLLCVNSAAVYSAAAADVPQGELLIVLVNSTKYGGAGGDIAVTSKDPSAVSIIQHELGHSIAGLADEYTSPYPGYPPCGTPDCPEPNATIVATRSGAKWGTWIDSSTPVPTPQYSGYGGVVGVFEGARYQTTGVYRPWESGCEMRQLNSPFCAVCREAMVLSFWRRALPLESPSPASATISTCGPVTFSVGHPAVSTTFSHLWTVDGTPQGTASPSLTVDAATFDAGTHAVAVTVQDETSFVRNDPENLLQATWSWSLTRAVCEPSGPCEASATCSGGVCSKTYTAAGTPCGAASCSDGGLSGSLCDGAGACAVGQTSCAPFTCNAAGTACLTSCSADTECTTPGDVCDRGACTKRGCGCSSGAGGASLAALLALVRLLSSKGAAAPAPSRAGPS
jgi:hypothetical protein